MTGTKKKQQNVYLGFFPSLLQSNSKCLRGSTGRGSPSPPPVAGYPSTPPPPPSIIPTVLLTVAAAASAAYAKYENENLA